MIRQLCKPFTAIVNANGGCYCIYSNGSKSYVDKKFCASVVVLKIEIKSADRKQRKNFLPPSQLRKPGGVKTYIRSSRFSLLEIEK